MIEAWLRPWADQKCFIPLARQGQRIGLTPNHITTLSGILGLLCGAHLLLGQVGLAVIMLLMSGLCDVLDGTLARLSQQDSHMGAAYDIVTDRVVEASVLLGLAYSMPTYVFWCLGMALAILICVTSFLVVGIFSQQQTGKSFDYSPGLIERPEAFCFFVMMMLWPTHVPLLAGLFILLTLWTALERLLGFKRSQACL